MSFIRLSSEYSISSYTLVDNLFLHEYMPGCPDNYLKVYLLGLYFAGAGGVSNTLENFCSRLSMTEDEVYEAFAYFEEYSLVSVLQRTPLTVSYSPASGLYAKPRKVKPQKYTEFAKQVQALLPGRLITPAEYSEYFNLIETYRIQQEALILIIKYCTIIKDPSISYRYISAVAKNWAARGITTLEACENELASFNAQSAAIGAVYKAMGLRGGADLFDSELYGKWTAELGFGREAIEYAAKSLRGKRPTMQRLDAVLLEYFRNRKFDVSEIAEYEQRKSALKDIAVSVNRALGEYVSDLTPVIETYVVPWTDAGFDGDTLAEIASHCFKVGVKSLPGMDLFVKKLLKLGVISKDALREYIDIQVERERVLQRILRTAGVGREVNSYDRDNYRLWSETWAVPDELILFAAEKSRGLSPIKTMHRLVSAFKQGGAGTLSQAGRIADGILSGGGYGSGHGGAPKSSFEDFERTEYSKEELSSLFDDIRNVDKL